MNEFVVITAVAVICLVLARAIVKESTYPKWKVVFFYVKNELLSIEEHKLAGYSVVSSELKLTLMESYELTAEQANDAITNSNDQDWFEKNIK